MALTEPSQPMAVQKRSAILLAGDLLAILAFAAVGRRSHGESAGIEAMLQVLETAAPFLVGWLVVSPFTGALQKDLPESLKPLAGRTALTWLIACPIGLVLRMIIRGTGIPFSFIITSLLFGLCFILGWRLIFSLIVRGKRSR